VKKLVALACDFCGKNLPSGSSHFNLNIKTFLADSNWCAECKLVFNNGDKRVPEKEILVDFSLPDQLTYKNSNN